MSKMGNNWRYAIIAVGLLALVLLIRDFNNRMADLRRLTREHEKVSAQATDAAATRSALQTLEVYAQSDQAVEEWAYGEGGMARPGDQVVYPLEASGESTPQAVTTEVAPQEISNWQLWMALFVDSPRTH